MLKVTGQHGRRQQGAVAPLDFHTWYRYIVDRGLVVLFFSLFCYFSVFFSVGPPPLEVA